MTRLTKKGIVISSLIDKSTLALSEGFYLEVIFLSHVIIEERLKSTLLKVYKNLGERNKIPGCIKKIKNLKEDKLYLFDVYFKDDLLKKILSWKKQKRDPLIHEIEQNYDLINSSNELESIAKDGNKLVRDLSTAIMKWKRDVKRQKLIT